MPQSSTPIGPTPPDFIVAEFSTALAPELLQPIVLLFALRSCMQRVNAGLVQHLGSDALSPGRMQLLLLLWAARAPVQQTRLVEMLHVSRASLSELLETLARDGLIRSIPDPTHGRRLLVQLTRKGRKAARTQLQNNARELSTAFASLDASEQQTLTQLLHRLCAFE